jgi:hypothetical protein
MFNHDLALTFAILKYGKPYIHGKCKQWSTLDDGSVSVILENSEFYKDHYTGQMIQALSILYTPKFVNNPNSEFYTWLENGDLYTLTVYENYHDFYKITDVPTEVYELIMALE